MDDSNRINGVFRCERLDIMPYLQMHGLTFTGDHEIDTSDNRVKVCLLFNDPKHIGNDLVMAWNKSQENDYRKWWAYFRDTISKILKGNNNGQPLI